MRLIYQKSGFPLFLFNVLVVLLLYGNRSELFSGGFPNFSSNVSQIPL